MLETHYESEQRAIGDYLYSKYLKGKDQKVISLGCGLGLCEEEYIRGGYNIELQECQGESFTYLEKKGLVIPKKWITTNLCELPKNEYDLVTMVHICYCFTDDELLDFYEHVKDILSEKGSLVVLAEAINFWDIVKEKINLNNIYNIYRKIVRKDDIYTGTIFWGYLRTMNKHEKMLKKVFRKVEKSTIGKKEIKTGTMSVFICNK